MLSFDVVNIVKEVGNRNQEVGIRNNGIERSDFLNAPFLNAITSFYS